MICLQRRLSQKKHCCSLFNDLQTYHEAFYLSADGGPANHKTSLISKLWPCIFEEAYKNTSTASFETLMYPLFYEVMKVFILWLKTFQNVNFLCLLKLCLLSFDGGTLWLKVKYGFITHFNPLNELFHGANILESWSFVFCEGDL